MSLIRSAAAVLIDRLAAKKLELAADESVEDYARRVLAFVRDGQLDFNETEIAALIKRAAADYARRMEPYYREVEQQLAAADARERERESEDAMVARVWAVNGWNETGAPDGSGPTFALGVEPRALPERSAVEPDGRWHSV